MKRAQITLYIILGIVVVTAIGAAVYVGSEISKDRVGGEVIRATAVPEEIESVYDYVENCIVETMEQGINLLGAQGGYIEIPSEVKRFNLYLGYDLAYWYFKGKQNEPITSMPSIREMEEELDNYMLRNLDSCINNFLYLGDEFDVRIGIDKLSQTAISDNKVSSKIRYPLTINVKDITFEFSDFVTDVRVKLGRIYNLASEIMKKENENTFLENLTLETLYLYDEEVPHFGLEFDCTPRIWKKQDIEDNFKNILEWNYPAVAIRNTKYMAVNDEYDRMIYDVTNKNYKDITVDLVYYQDWPFEFDIFPSKGEIVGSEVFDGSLKYIDFCVDYMNLIYDIKYPVLISLSDGEYNFDFVTEVVIESNNPREKLEDYPEFEDKYLDYCEMQSTDVSVSTGVPSASVLYNCVNNLCYIGTTDIYGDLDAKFPPCVNGMLTIKKEGYADYKETLTTLQTSKSKVYASVSLQQWITKPYEIKVINKETKVVRDLKRDEEAIIELSSYIGERFDHSAAAILPSGEIKIIPTTYIVDGILIKKGNVKIKSEEIEQCKCPKLFDICFCGTEITKLEGTTLNNVVIGGVETMWFVSKSELDSANKIIFYVIDGGTPTSYTDLSRNINKGELTLGLEITSQPDLK